MVWTASLVEGGGVVSVDVGRLPNRDARVDGAASDWPKEQWGDLDMLGAFRRRLSVLAVLWAGWWLDNQYNMRGSGLALAPSKKIELFRWTMGQLFFCAASSLANDWRLLLAALRSLETACDSTQ